jgi:hypothetical protein
VAAGLQGAPHQALSRVNARTLRQYLDGLAELSAQIVFRRRHTVDYPLLQTQVGFGEERVVYLALVGKWVDILMIKCAELELFIVYTHQFRTV